MANINFANIKAPIAPSLPIAPNLYSQDYVNQLTNALRLYFNQLDKVFQYTVRADIGQFIDFPFLAALDTNVQAATVVGNSYPITFDTPYLPTYYAGPNASAPYIDPLDASSFVIPNSHYYNFNYSINFY